MGKHNLAYQFQTAIDKAFTPGLDKYAAKHSGEAMHKVCSFNEKKSLQEVVYQFKDYMKQSYPNLKMVKDIKADHWQSFLNEKSKTCSSATLKNYVSRINKLEVLCQNKFNFKSSWGENILVPQSQKTIFKEKLRVQTMDKSDLKRILDYGYRYCVSRAVPAIELCYRFGLRSFEVSNIKVRDVDFEKKLLHVIGKGGRHRNIDIMNADVELLRKLCKGKTNDDELIKIKADSINQQINRILQKLNLKDKYPLTSIHAIRKLKAQELWNQKREIGWSKKDTMNYVSKYLGHGKNRYDVINTYIHDQH